MVIYNDNKISVDLPISRFTQQQSLSLKNTILKLNSNSLKEVASQKLIHRKKIRKICNKC